MPSRFHFEEPGLLNPLFPRDRWHIHFGFPQRSLPNFVVKGFMLVQTLGRMLLQTGGRMKMEADV